MEKPLNIFIVAGESSGDIYASLLMEEMKLKRPNSRFIGIGGNRMTTAGLEKIIDISKISILGFAEVFKNLKLFHLIFKKCENIFETRSIDLLICVDFPGFNLRLTKIAKKYKIPVCYYVAPQVWAWGKKRVKIIHNYVDLLLVVFPFEKDFFSKYVQNVEFVGHPILDLPVFKKPILKFEERTDTIVLMPGSRKIEVMHHISLISRLIETIKSYFSKFEIAIPVSNSDNEKILKDYLGDQSKLVRFEYDSHNVLRSSKVGIIKSGTSNLEAALLGLPFVMFYKTSLPTYLIARGLINVEYISIVNILLGGNYVPEYIQGLAKPEKILASVKTILENREVFQQMLDSFLRLRYILGESGGTKKAVENILKYFSFK